MALFQVHPHFGYLNSDVKLINGSDAALKVRDKVSDKDYIIPALSHITVKLSAGEHVFVSDDESILDKVVVEDAIKLGGSSEKKSFVFEGTPWAIMIMLDRTYFFNRETKEQYLEHGIAPKDIKFLTSNYLLFVSDNDNSIFSLDNLSVVQTFGGSDFLFSNAHAAVFSSEKGVIIFNLDNAVEDRTIKIDCKEYVIDEGKGVLYYHKEESRNVIAKQLATPEAKESVTTLPEAFRCFIGYRSAIYGANTQKLSITHLDTKDAAVLYENEIPVTKINDTVVWENGLLAATQSKDITDAFTSFSELQVFESGDRWPYIHKTVHTLKYSGRISSKNSYCLRICNKTGSYLDSDQPITVIHGKNYDLFMNNPSKGVMVQAAGIRHFEGTPKASPSGYVLLSNELVDKQKTFTDPLNRTFSYTYAGTEAERLFEKTGLIKREIHPGDNGNKVSYRFADIETGRIFTNSLYEDLELQGFFRLSGGVGDYIHSIDGYVKPMPCVKDRLVAISEQCNYAIIRNEDGIALLKYDSENKGWKGSALEKMDIDESFYSKAVFCSDGENIIYQKKGKEFYLRSINSDEEVIFKPEASVIRRNINGYIPYLDFDTHRRPVYVDPVSLTRIEAAAAGQYTYQSIDGSIKHIEHNVVKYLDRRTASYVSKETYDSYVAKYDYETEGFLVVTAKTNAHNDGVRNNRIAFYNANKAWLDEKLRHRIFGPLQIERKDCLQDFLSRISVCDSILFKKEFYVREQINGDVVDIKLPEVLNFLNYVSYSYDNRYIIISGRFPLNSFYKGLALVYDVKNRETVYVSTSSMAVWLGVFSKQGTVAYYDSTPSSFISNNIANKDTYEEVPGRSFLTFSPSGKYMAFSHQGYIPYVSGNPHWGHQPSRDVYIAKSSSPKIELAHYCDHGDQIEGTGGWDRTNSSVASATFSKDEKRLMTVSKDGVVVIRNLHLEDPSETREDDLPF